jgi:class 3 adenylate cyclase/tetratricopeptide (TPR) repeat protein
MKFEANRKIASILSADVVGYSRLMEDDEAATLATLKECRAIFDRVVAAYGGREFGSVGDSLMAEFPSAVNSLRAALEIQAELRLANESLPDPRKMSLRIGLNLGDVIEDKDLLFGDGVNAAARLQAEAPPGGILVSGSIHEQVHKKVDLGFHYEGSRKVKNISRPIPAYRVLEKGSRARSGIFGELRRRKVFRSAFSYLIVAWVLVEVASVVLPAFDAPDWLLRALITVLVVGFPPVLILAWVFDLTPIGFTATDGVHGERRIFKTMGARLAVAVPMLALTGVGVWWIWSGNLAGNDFRVSGAETRIEQPVIAVTPIRNLTGNEEYDWLGDGVANLVRDRLAQSRYLTVVSQPRWQSIARGIEDPTDLNEAAADANINYVLSGEVISSPGGLILTTRVTDVAAGTDVVAQADENLTEEKVLESVYRIAVLAKQGLKVPHADQLDSFAADFAVQNFAAYRAYISGLQYFDLGAYDEAEQTFNAALELSPEFHVVRYRLAMLYSFTGERQKAAAILKDIPDDARVSRREQLYIDAISALLEENDRPKAIEVYQGILAEFPFEIEARRLLAEVYQLDFQDDAAVEQLRLLARQDAENPHVWGPLGDYLTLMGRYQEAEEALQKYLDLAPGNPNAHGLLGQLERQRENFGAAIERYETALDLDPNYRLARLGIAETRAAAGDIATAIELLRPIADDAELELEERVTAVMDLAWLLRAQSLPGEAIRTWQNAQDIIDREQFRVAESLRHRAVCLLDLDRSAEARELLTRAIKDTPSFGGVPTRYLFSRGLLELQTGALDEVLATAAEIETHALPADNPDRTEEKAAAYLRGLRYLQRNEPKLAIVELEKARTLEGFRYAIYDLGYAKALHAAGRVEDSLALSEQALKSRDPGDLRLDLEWDRARASEFAIRLALESGATMRAEELTSEHKRRWGRLEPVSANSKPAPLLGDSTSY